ncbi:sulfotransferase [Flammeovirga sp. SJP92]|uniref:sulfotransferase n=1 Tax=Flammeovirga sp. SJP92 TaxID=1775430 RepID=UPI0007892D5B|nr:sulfotransferase [Flammeovirga sp. SJP92]KXX70417.1 hypothetical protein AVL50_09055 [Flammeovirga sp. SJP92]
MDNKIICIAGMHRSGTSLFTDYLQQLGVFIGKDLLGSASSNKRGHYEDKEFLKLHVEDLKLKGLDPDGLLHVKSPLYFEPSILRKAKDLVNRRNAEHSLWGWKEPRSVLYLQHWKEIIPNLNIIYINRPDIEIVDSLMRREIKIEEYRRTLYRNPINYIKSYILFKLYLRKRIKDYKKTCDVYRESVEKVKKDDSRFLEISLHDLLKDNLKVYQLIETFLSVPLNKVDITNFFNPQWMKQDSPLIKEAKCEDIFLERNIDNE